jgi:hypothetical protein
MLNIVFEKKMPETSIYVNGLCASCDDPIFTSSWGAGCSPEGVLLWLELYAALISSAAGTGLCARGGATDASCFSRGARRL